MVGWGMSSPRFHISMAVATPAAGRVLEILIHCQSRRQGTGSGIANASNVEQCGWCRLAAAAVQREEDESALASVGESGAVREQDRALHSARRATTPPVHAAPTVAAEPSCASGGGAARHLRCGHVAWFRTAQAVTNDQ